MICLFYESQRINSLNYIAQLINMKLVQVATCTGPKYIHVETCTTHLVQVAKSQLVHNIYICSYILITNYNNRNKLLPHNHCQTIIALHL